MLVCLVAFLCSASPNDIPLDIQERVLQATVRLNVDREDGYYRGTGALIYQGADHVLVLTATHVIRGQHRMEITYWPHDDAAYRTDAVRVEALASNTDLAILHVTTTEQAPAVLPICASQDLAAFPFPVATTGCNERVPSLALGEAIGTDDLDGDELRGKFILLDVFTAKGRSGGPVVDRFGRIVGCCYGSRDNSGLYAHISEIHELLAAANLTELLCIEPEPRDVVMMIASTRSDTPVWLEPDRYLASCAVVLRLAIGQPNGFNSFPAPLAITVTPSSATADQLSPVRLTVSEPGTAEIPIPLEITLGGPTTVDLKVTIDSPPAWASCTQTAWSTSLILSPPPRLSLQCEARPLRIHSVTWHDLDRGVAEIQLDARFSLVGSVTRPLTMSLDRPATAHSLSPTSVVVGQAAETIRIVLVAELRPNPHRTRFVISLPDQTLGAVDVAATRPLSFSIVGPEPARVALAQQNAVSETLSATRSGSGDQYTMTVCPVVAGSGNEEAHWSGDVHVTATPNLEVRANAALSLGTPVTLIVRPKAQKPRSFFRDTTLSGEIQVEPASSSSAVTGSRHQVHLIRPAPFKRLLVLMLGALFILVSISLPYYLIHRLFFGTSKYDGTL